MDTLPPPLAFLILLCSGWVNRQQQAVIDYLLEENRVLRAAHAPRRFRLTDDQRRRLAVKGQVLGRRRLAAVAGIVTPDTILRWYRRFVAQKYDGSKQRRAGRPATKPDLVALGVRMANENPSWGYTRIRGAICIALASGLSPAASRSRTRDNLSAGRDRACPTIAPHSWPPCRGSGPNAISSASSYSTWARRPSRT
jgi:hypothetical protein